MCQFLNKYNFLKSEFNFKSTCILFTFIYYKYTMNKNLHDVRPTFVYSIQL